ncbi:SDR family NAD(P)-dependent oxidoreductase [Nonomuraea sp. NPDC049695]|uniref:SDR family NAD(P)-dependent oxidoreductase n=1 Tax=Nonomuraea sp. NPDC049695 TaxID=3154734 RepID=UPI0034304B3D
MPDYYAGRAAVITGAGSGIGRALALDLAARGSCLALADLDGDAVEQTARACRELTSTVEHAQLDVTDRAAVTTYATTVAERLGQVEAVFAVAGVIHTGSLLRSDLADFDHIISVNLLGMVNTAKAFLPHLIASGRGHLVTMSSAYGFLAAPYSTAYNASKFAVRGFSEALRQELRLQGHPVTVTCVFPGAIDTAIMRKGTFAPGIDPAAAIKRFAAMARTDVASAAAAILRGTARGRSQVLIGSDAKRAWLVVRLLGSAYQRVVPWLVRRRSAETT